MRLDPRESPIAERIAEPCLTLPEYPLSQSTCANRTSRGIPSRVRLLDVAVAASTCMEAFPTVLQRLGERRGDYGNPDSIDCHDAIGSGDNHCRVRGLARLSLWVEDVDKHNVPLLQRHHLTPEPKLFGPILLILLGG